MNNHLQFIFHAEEQALKEILIASLSALDFSGFEETEKELIAYIEEEHLKEEEVEDLSESLGVSFTKSTIKKQNWNQLWESNFSPVLVDDFCLIRADFHPADSTVQHEVVITPKMSFGTGHHATTYMMVQHMREIDFNNKKTADFGTGTGILAILAEKLGSNSVWAIDYDEWSIENARENIDKNGCKSIALENKDSFSTNEKFDVILANINRNVILDNLGGLVFGLQENGVLLVSGILKDDEPAIVAAAQMQGISYVKTIEKDKWISILFHK